MARCRTWALTAAGLLPRAWCRRSTASSSSSSSSSHVLSGRLSRRPFSAHPSFSRTAEPVHVAVPCALSGHVVVSLYHISDHAPTTPVLLYLPPTAAAATADPVAPPAFLLHQPFPVVAVHYRWAAGPTTTTAAGAPCWPTPLHDVLFAYDWLRRRLAPSSSSAAAGASPRRDLFVYGTHLGAGLALALALTETRPHRAVAVRGVAAYNGVYNWTAFGEGETETEAPLFATPAALFAEPADLLDPFASPSLFFRTPRAARALPPAAFGEAWPEAWPAAPEETRTDAAGLGRAYLAFPPARSRLAVPATLLLHDGDDDAATVPTSKKKKRAKYPETTPANNSYAAQAAELAALMRRSVSRATATATTETTPDPEQHIQTAAVAAKGAPGPRALAQPGQARLLGWLAAQMRDTASRDVGRTS